MDIRECSLSINKMEIHFAVNGTNYTLQVEPTASLIDILRENLMLTGTKVSCEIGRCGACAVLLNGTLVNSCLVMAYQIDKASIVTDMAVLFGLFREHKQAWKISRKGVDEDLGFQCRKLTI